MISKKLLTILGILMLVSILALSACQPAATEAPAEETPVEDAQVEEVEPADEFKVALLLPGSANDQSWNQLAFDGVMAAKENLGIEVAFSENVDHTVEVDAIRDYAEQGYDVIIGHSGSYEEAMVTLGPEYPDVHMIIIAGSKGGGDNVTAVDTAPWQVGFAEGYIAGLTTENDYVAFITAGEGMQVMNNFVGSWKDGVKAANPDATACVVYVPDWGDVAAAREAATALHEDGADVIMHELNRATQGVIDACNELGCLTNVRLQEQIDGAPDVSIMGVDYAWDQRFTAVIQKIMNDELPGGAFFFGFNTPGEGFNFFYGADEFNSNIVTGEMMDGFHDDVVDKFIADPLLEYSVDQAKGGCE